MEKTYAPTHKISFGASAPQGPHSLSALANGLSATIRFLFLPHDKLGIASSHFYLIITHVNDYVKSKWGIFSRDMGQGYTNDVATQMMTVVT